MADRKRTNAEIDYLNQFLKEGEAKLPYEVADNNPTDNSTSPNLELTDEQKAEQELRMQEEKEAADKQKKIDKEIEDEKNRVLAQAKEKENPAPVQEELDDDKVLAYLKSKKGKEIISLDDLINPKVELTEAEKLAAKEQRENEKFAFGLSQKKFSKKELEEFITDTKDPVQLVFAAYYADQKAKDDTLKDDEIQAEFDEKFGIDEEDKESRKYKTGQLLINKIAGGIIKDKHSKILNLENDYSVYENTTASQNAESAKIQAQTPIYKRDVEQVRNEMKNVNFQIGKETFQTEISEAVVSNVISSMLEPSNIEKHIKRGWTKADVLQLAQTTAIIQDMPNLMQKYADAEVLKKQSGSRGIIPERQRGGRKIEESDLSENQKKALSFYGEKLVAN